MKKIIILSVIIISFIVGIALYGYMPAEMASHWNAEGKVNGYLPRFWGLFLMPILSAGLYILFLILPSIDPLRKNIDSGKKYFDTFFVLLICFLFYVYIASILWNLGIRFDIVYVTIPALSVILYYSGILMEHTHRNWFVGIKTPWTLSDDAVWEKTHKLGAKAFKWYSIIMLISIFPVRCCASALRWVIICPLLFLISWLYLYSYVEYKKLHK